MPRRGCGYRIAGGVYATYGVNPNPDLRDNAPTAPFVMRDPILVDPATLGISPVGVTMVQRNGVWHLIDWIGEQHYPTVREFLAEAEMIGVSRRVPRTLDFSRFTAESRILCVHRHAGGENRPAIFASFPIEAWQVVRDEMVAGRAGEQIARMTTGWQRDRDIPVQLVRE